jgi:hypothetical protein
MIQWVPNRQALPKDLPPRSTVNDYMRRWTDDGTLGRIHHALFVKCREQVGRDVSPAAAIIAGLSVKAADKSFFTDPTGYDAGKKIEGKQPRLSPTQRGPCCAPLSTRPISGTMIVDCC